MKRFAYSIGLSESCLVPWPRAVHKGVKVSNYAHHGQHVFNSWLAWKARPFSSSFPWRTLFCETSRHTIAPNACANCRVCRPATAIGQTEKKQKKQKVLVKPTTESFNDSKSQRLFQALNECHSSRLALRGTWAKRNASTISFKSVGNIAQHKTRSKVPLIAWIQMGNWGIYFWHTGIPFRFRFFPWRYPPCRSEPQKLQVGSDTLPNLNELRSLRLDTASVGIFK